VEDPREVPIGAVVVLNHEICGRGSNAPIRIQTLPLMPRSSPLARLRKKLRSYRLENATLYVTLEPCAMCAGALVAARVRTLVFASRDIRFGGIRGKFRVADSGLLNHKVEIIEGVLPGTDQSLFEQRR
jgi:tRNA(adenine34) deaminase